ncbi:hypothetical protein K402DRAFT_60644 [Aulographum hederae CBS 113979]|uniref:Uncharacterized protein n=1 Tax=Aulographum hederae CBS 113979 TaxID=1176131 RepID=A0A6G1H181_9PEZI|nr:hypothetical protein K402DRAFT_60644 [Aulographum hederae CBS 113979]
MEAVLFNRRYRLTHSLMTSNLWEDQYTKRARVGGGIFWGSWGGSRHVTALVIGSQSARARPTRRGCLRCKRLLFNLDVFRPCCPHATCRAFYRSRQGAHLSLSRLPGGLAATVFRTTTTARNQACKPPPLPPSSLVAARCCCPSTPRAAARGREKGPRSGAARVDRLVAPRDAINLEMAPPCRTTTTTTGERTRQPYHFSSGKSGFGGRLVGREAFLAVAVCSGASYVGRR